MMKILRALSVLLNGSIIPVAEWNPLMIIGQLLWAPGAARKAVHQATARHAPAASLWTLLLGQ